MGVSVDFAQQTVRDVLKSTAKDTMHFIGKESFDGKRWRDGTGRLIKEPNGVRKVEKRFFVPGFSIFGIVPCVAHLYYKSVY